MTYFLKPQSLWWRKLIFQVHLWVGIGTGLYVLLIGITGASLVFREEMEHALHADLFQPSVAEGAKPDLLAAAEKLRRAYPDRQLTGVYMPSEEVRAMTAYLYKHEQYLAVYMDPANGKVLGELNEEGSFLRWLQRLHFDLLAGRTGRIVNGVGALFLLALCLTGMVIWWPGVKHWKRSLRVDLSKKWKRLNWDLHSATGFWALPVLMIWALTGAYFAWPAEFRNVINWFSPVSLAKVTPPNIAEKGKRPAPDIRALIAEAQSKSPSAKLSGISFPVDDKGHYRVYMAREAVGDYDRMDYHYFDQFTGRHVAMWQRGLNQTAGDVIMFWIGPLHFGTFGGVWVKILWLCLGLFPPLLFVTGSLMYWNRYLSKKWARLKTKDKDDRLGELEPAQLTER